jgi:hypothetical protein
MARKSAIAPDVALAEISASLAEVTSAVAPASAEVPANVSPLPSTHVSSVPAAPADLKQWLDSGKQLARDTFAAYRERFANLRRRK